MTAPTTPIPKARLVKVFYRLPNDAEDRLVYYADKFGPDRVPEFETAAKQYIADFRTAKPEDVTLLRVEECQ